MKKIIVVGGGIAGLSAGIYGRKSGYEVEIYEKNPIAGGQCMGWNRNNHHIDNCIHWLTGTKKNTGLRNLWQTIGALDEDTKMVEQDKFYTSIHNERSATLWRDIEKTKDELIALSIEDKDEIEKFIENVRLAQCTQMPVDKPIDMLNIIELLKLGKSMSGLQKVMKEYGKITIDEFSQRFKDPLLQKVFSDFLPKEYLASYFIITYATMSSGNGDLPVGGSLNLTNRVVDRFKELGGVLHLNQEVSKVFIENGKAKYIILEDGTKVMADYIICATDTYETFSKLIGFNFQNRQWQEYYASSEYNALSAFQIAFSVNKSDYTDNDTVFFDCEPIEVGYKKVDRIALRSYSYEEDFAPEGKTVLQVNIIQLMEDFEYWHRLDKKTYDNKKKEITQSIIDELVKRYPDLNNKIEVLDIWTPLTYKRYTNAYRGAYMSFNARKGSKAVNEKGIIKEVSNLLLAGQWLQGPGGLPAAASTGKFAIQRILKKDKKSYKI